jgi:hypothetical protein
MSPVHQRSDGTWWFWDETWADAYGAYATEEAAKIGCRQYGDWLDGKGHFMPPDEFIDKIILRLK